MFESEIEENEESRGWISDKNESLSDQDEEEECRVCRGPAEEGYV